MLNKWLPTANAGDEASSISRMWHHTDDNVGRGNQGCGNQGVKTPVKFTWGSNMLFWPPPQIFWKEIFSSIQISWFSGKSLKLLPPDIIFYGCNAPNSILGLLQTLLGELKELPQTPEMDLRGHPWNVVLWFWPPSQRNSSRMPGSNV